MQLQLFPGNLTRAQFEAGNAALGALPLAMEPAVNQTINGDWSLKFDYPMKSAQQLTLGGLVLADGQLYRIESLKRSSQRGADRLEVSALHLVYDLRDRFIVNIETAETTPGGINQRTALQQVINGTAFTDGTVDTPILLDYLDILQKDAMWALKDQVLGLWGGELQPDNWTIHLRAQMGTDRGVHLRQGKNILGVSFQESLDGVITRLHVRGYKGANFESINDGKDYIDSAYIGNYPTIREGMVSFDDDDLPEDLMQKGLAYLATVDTPRIQLTVDLARLRGSAQYALYRDLERVELGDTVTVWHEGLGINITARVQSRDFDPVSGENHKITLGNDDRNLYTAMASAQQAAEIVKMITDRNSHVRGEKLRGVIDLLTTQLMASGSFSNVEVREGQGALFENHDATSPDYGALYIGPGLLAIANTKDPDSGSWIWRTFGTGQGFAADEIVTGTLNAELIRILGTEQFYWDADSIKVTDPENPLRQMRIGRYDGINYGIGLTIDGGATWRGAYGFDGFNLSFASIPQENVGGLGTALGDISTNLTAVEGDVSGLLTSVTNLKNTTANNENYIRAGALYTGADGRVRYGIAIGETLVQVVDEHGNTVIKKETLAQTHTSDRQSFWQNGVEIAFFANNRLYVNDVSAISSISIGDWLIDVENGFTIGLMEA